MKAKTMVGIAVASALSWSYGAIAGGAYGHMGSDSTYGVVTPFSPNEAGPAMLPYGERYATVGTHHTSAGVPAHEAGVHEPMHAAGMADRRGRMPERMSALHGSGDRRASLDTARTSASLPNPQTPWYSFEGGLNTYVEDMQQRRQHVAEVEQARIAAAQWNASIAASESTGLERSSSLGLVEPTGGTSGVGIHGSIGSSGAHPSWSEPSTSSDFRSEAGTPSEVERTGWMRPETGEPVSVTEYSAVGILEMPSAPSEHTVWNVEPLTPNADLASGDTLSVAPDGADLAGFTPQFDRSSSIGETGDRSAGMSEETEAHASPSL